jgi:hypothetical protein
MFLRGRSHQHHRCVPGNLGGALGLNLVAAAADALPPDQPKGLTAMFDDYEKHGFHGGNALALRMILQRETRSVSDYIEELGQREPHE